MFLPSNFTLRKTAFGVATAAMVGVSALSAFPAAAQTTYGLASKQSTPVSLKLRDCSKEPAGLRAVCESFNRTEQAKARGAAAQSVSQQAQNSTACMEAVGKQIEAAKKAGPLSPEQKIRFRTQIESCDKT